MKSYCFDSLICPFYNKRQYFLNVKHDHKAYTDLLQCRFTFLKSDTTEICCLKNCMDRLTCESKLQPKKGIGINVGFAIEGYGIGNLLL